MRRDVHAAAAAAAAARPSCRGVSAASAGLRLDLEAARRARSQDEVGGEDEDSRRRVLEQYERSAGVAATAVATVTGSSPLC